MPSFLGGIRSFILSKYLASSNPLILCVGENPHRAVMYKTKLSKTVTTNKVAKLRVYGSKLFFNNRTARSI